MPRSFVKEFRWTPGRWMQRAEIPALQDLKRYGGSL